MKKGIFAIAVALGFIALQSQTKATTKAIASTNQNEKVTICHREGNGGHHSITVSINAVPAHLAHGDSIGDCDDNLPTRTAQ